MRAIRKPDGSIELQDAPEGAVPWVVDDVHGPFGTVPLTLHVKLPDGRIVGVAIKAEDGPGRTWGA